MDEFKGKVTEKNIREFADLKNGYASGRFDYQTGGTTSNEMVPFEGELDASEPTAKLVPFDGTLDNPTSHTFKSGSAFEETLKMIPGVDDMKEAWDTFQKQWANRKNTPMTAKVASKMMQDEQAAGSGVLDIAGGLPAMLAGGVHGAYDAVTNMDASKGLKTGSETMSNLLPSSLLGNKKDQESEGYHAMMAPVTAVMDTLNAVPQGYGEILNAAGAPKAAAQVTDAGKLGIMLGFGAKGTHALLKGKRAPVDDSAAKLEALMAEVEREVNKADTAVATIAHADDFAAINPYDVGGHVTEAKEGRPATIDQAQGELFGGDILQEAARAPDLGQESIRHDTIPYEKEFPFSLEERQQTPREIGINMPEREQGLSLVPKEEPLPEMNTTRAYPEALAENRAKMEAPEPLENSTVRDAYVKAERDQAFSEIEKVSAREKEAHYAALEDLEVARKAGELDYRHAKDTIGDKSLMGQEHTIAMRGQLRMGDLNGALNTLMKNHPNEAYRELAGYLQGKLEGLKVTMHPESIVKMGNRDVTGYYDPTNNIVGLSGLGASSPHTLLHELTHAITSKFINDRPTDIRVLGLTNLHKMLGKTSRMTKEFPGIVNAKEFVAEAFSNPSFQKFLKSEKIDNRSVWNRFVDGVKSLLGIKGQNQLATAFDHAIDLGKQIAEAQTGKQLAMEQFKQAGVPKALADLMAQTPHDMSSKTKVHEGMDKVVSKIPGLESPISDFAFYDKPLPEIIEMAKTSPDIPTGMMEKFAQQMQGGALFESLKTRNPVVKYTYERITRAFQEASNNVKENLTNPETGLKRYMRDLTPIEKGEIHQAMMLAEGQKELGSADLAAMGFNEKQIAYAMKHRELDNQFFNAINARRVAQGMIPMDKRTAHIAGRFMGDFARMVFHDGKVVGRISGATRAELTKVTKFMQEKHPEWTFEKEEYNKIGHGQGVKDRFSGMMEAINFLEKSDSSAKALMDSYKGYLQQDAVNYLNATRHAKAKIKEAGGVVGSEGNKPWLEVEKNAEEGMKAQLVYYEQGYQWMAMEKATNDIKQLLGNEEVVKQVPRAVEYADKYVKHSMGRDQGKISDALNGLLSTIGEQSGLGHSNIMKLNANVKHLIMQKFMGLGNIPFTLTQLMQPLQTQPAMIRLLRSRGLEFSTLEAQTNAATTYLNSMLRDQGVGKLSKFESDAVAYADQMSIFDVKMADHTKDINVSKLKEGYDKLADINITAPEHLTRGMSFLFYSHLLKDAGVPTKDIFGAAENMTNMSMVNYHQIERPMGYAKLGWLGDIASTLTRYKHNQWSQLAFYAREARKAENGIKSSAPLATFLGASLAFGGALGFFAFQEADSAYSLIAENIFKKPDSLTNQILKAELPSAVTHGLFSSVGVDMTSRFSNANTIPDSIPAALMPYGSAIWDMAATTGRFVIDPTSVTKAKQMGKAFAPQSVQGVLENEWFTQKSANGKDLYINSTDGPNFGKGRIERTEGDQRMRAFGFRNLSESKELAQNYADGQIAKGHSNIADKQVNKAKYEAMDNTLTSERLQELTQEAAKHGMSPDAFMSQLVSWKMANKLPQKQQNLLRNANKGFTGAFNIKESR
jgi:hypothetical protein